MKAIKYKKGVYYRSTNHIGGDRLAVDAVGGDRLAIEAKGGDIVSSVISKIPYELHMRDTSLKKYSYCGR